MSIFNDERDFASLLPLLPSLPRLFLSLSLTPNVTVFYVLRQMFVRLFVDENLDRIVPISKQPKEKIQAIIDACARQFPEFAERTRKRIRTYLKSCRRNKRTRDSNGWETVGPPRLSFEWDSL